MRSVREGITVHEVFALENIFLKSVPILLSNSPCNPLAIDVAHYTV